MQAHRPGAGARHPSDSLRQPGPSSHQASSMSDGVPRTQHSTSHIIQSYMSLISPHNKHTQVHLPWAEGRHPSSRRQPGLNSHQVCLDFDMLALVCARFPHCEASS